MSQELRVLIIEDDPDVRLGCEQAMMLADLPVEVTVLDPVSVDGKTRQALCLEASALMSGGARRLRRHR